MSFDACHPSSRGRAGLTEWCRRDRSDERILLAAAAGDPVALAGLRAQLTAPRGANPAAPLVEIIAARRPSELEELADRWPDANDPSVEPDVVSRWMVALRHLAARGRIDARAALEGPLAAEARRVLSCSTFEPVAWASFCAQARRRPFTLNELRTVHRLGFGETSLDVTPLSDRPRSLLRVLRGRWEAAIGLDDLLDGCDLSCNGPLDLAVWWEAMTCAARVTTDRESLADSIVERLLGEDRPARWWPAVLAVLTDWTVP